MRVLRVSVLALLAALAAVFAASAASATTPTTTVIAEGLDNPRGLAVTHDGSLLVAEAGRGGPGPCITIEGETACLGQTGAVTLLSPGHKGKPRQTRIVTGLPSLAGPTGEAATGPHDVAIGRNGEVLATIGLATDPALRADLGAGGSLLGTLIAAGPKGTPRVIADLAAFEGEADPDQGLPGTTPDSNPYGLLVTRRGVYATDAGGNTLLRVGAKGDISVLGVFPPRFVPGPEPGSEIPMQAVPTTVTRGPDGALYVGQLTGFPFPVGGANVYRIEKGGEPEVYAEGFTNIIDIAFDRRGRLHVLEFAANGLLSGDPAGALTRIEADGSRTAIDVPGLIAPGGLAFGRDGAIYITNKSILAGGGEVLRIS